MQWEGDQLYSRAEASHLWTSEMWLPLAFSSCASQSLYLDGFFSVEDVIFALVLLLLLFPPIGGKDMFSNEQAYIFHKPPVFLCG